MSTAVLSPAPINRGSVVSLIVAILSATIAVPFPALDPPTKNSKVVAEAFPVLQVIA